MFIEATNQHPVCFTGRMPFLSPDQQCQSTEGKISHSMDLLTPSSPGGLPTLSQTTNSSWLPPGEGCHASYQPSDASTPFNRNDSKHINHVIILSNLKLLSVTFLRRQACKAYYEWVNHRDCVHPGFGYSLISNTCRQDVRTIAIINDSGVMHIAILMTILLRLLCLSASHWTEKQIGCVGTVLELTIGYNESCFCFCFCFSLSYAQIYSSPRSATLHFFLLL